MSYILWPVNQKGFMEIEIKLKVETYLFGPEKYQ
jgi:hypothetical protein